MDFGNLFFHFFFYVMNGFKKGTRKKISSIIIFLFNLFDFVKVVFKVIIIFATLPRGVYKLLKSCKPHVTIFFLLNGRRWNFEMID